MKTIILFFILSVSIFAQTYDSLTVTWSDSPSSDLDSTYLVYWKVNPVVDTTIFARINEGIETWSGVAPDSGLLYIAAVGLDDSSNFCLDSASVFDTVTVWVQAGGSFNPEDLNPVINLYYDTDSLVVSGSKTVASFTYNNRVFNAQDTTTAENIIVQTDSSLYFAATGVKRLNWTYQAGSEFELGTSDFSFEFWYFYDGNATGMASLITKNWSAGLFASEGHVSPIFMFYNPAQDSTTQFFLSLNFDSLEAGWRHIVITADRDGDREIYIDSVLATQTEVYDEPAAATWTYFRSQNLNNTHAMSLGYQGIRHVATIRMYKSLLSPAQIKQLYEYGLSNGRR